MSILRIKILIIFILLTSLTGKTQIFIPFSFWNNMCKGATAGPFYFTYTGAEQNITVPAGCNRMRVKAWGAGGGSDGGGANTANIATLSAAGGGGGSSFSVVTGTQTAGSGTTPGNSTDSIRTGNAGEGGAAVGTGTAGNDGNNGLIVIYLLREKNRTDIIN